MGSQLRHVDHTYRDYSRYVEDGGELIKHKKSGNNFPARLHQMLSEPQFGDIIAWMPHGRAWKVLDKERLTKEVIPKYLVGKKYESFTRQLNGWGFKRLHQSGPDFGCYYHECFLRDLPKITCLIRRLPPHIGKSAPYAEGEPNFYRISAQFPVPPLPTSSAPEAARVRSDSATSSHGEAPSRDLTGSLSPAVSDAATRGVERPPSARKVSETSTSAEAPGYGAVSHVGGPYHGYSQHVPRPNEYPPSYYYGYAHYHGQFNMAEPQPCHYQAPFARQAPVHTVSSANCVSEHDHGGYTGERSRQENELDAFEPIPLS